MGKKKLTETRDSSSHHNITMANSTNHGVIQINHSQEALGYRSYRELLVQWREHENALLRQRNQRCLYIFVGYAFALAAILVDQAFSGHLDLHTLKLWATGLGFPVFLGIFIPLSTTERRLEQDAAALLQEMKHRQAFEGRATAGKFNLGQRVWCERENQYGNVISPARLRISDMRTGLTPPSNPKAIPSYDVLFDNDDARTLAEPELETLLAGWWRKASTWTTQHNALLTVSLAIVTAAIALAALFMPK